MAKKNGDKRLKEIRSAKARRNYAVEETLEAGIVLVGTEVKSIRAGLAQINDAFARIEKGRLYMYHAHIAEYKYGNVNNHDPYRPRELLIKKAELRKWQQEVESGGRTIVPLRMYFKKALIKVELALATGKKLHDKRQDLKKKVEMREAEREMRKRQIAY